MFLYYKYLLRGSLVLLAVQGVLGFLAWRRLPVTPECPSAWASWVQLVMTLCPGTDLTVLWGWVRTGLLCGGILHVGLIYSIILLHQRDPSLFWRLFLHANNLSLALWLGLYGWIWLAAYWLGTRLGKHVCLIYETR